MVVVGLWRSRGSLLKLYVDIFKELVSVLPCLGVAFPGFRRCCRCLVCVCARRSWIDCRLSLRACVGCRVPLVVGAWLSAGGLFRAAGVGTRGGGCCRSF